MAFGKNKQGKTARAGGWGYVFGDEGGGFDITRRAVRAALRAEEGWGPRTSIRDTLLAATGSADANTMLHRFYTPEFTRPQIAGFARLVTDAAASGDDVAVMIVNEAAAELATYVEGLYQNLFQSGEEVLLAHIGGVFQSALLLNAFASAVKKRIGLTTNAPLLSPAAGALLQALRAAGNPADLEGVPGIGEMRI